MSERTSVVITRREGERVLIGDGLLEVMPIYVGHGRVQLRILTAENITVCRPGSLQDRKDRETFKQVRAERGRRQEMEVLK